VHWKTIQGEIVLNKAKNRVKINRKHKMLVPQFRRFVPSKVRRAETLLLSTFPKRAS
jgi:hypothetical protein